MKNPAKQLKELYSEESYARVRNALDGSEVLKRVTSARAAVIDQLIAAGELVLADAGQTLCTEGEDSNDVYFIVRGSVSIVSGLSEIARRADGEFVGEMSLLLLAPRRSATMKTRDATVLWKVSGRKFEPIANAEPLVWRGLALRLCHRLKERNWMVPEENALPVVFLGSSNERLADLRSIESELRKNGVACDLRLWADAFRPGDLTLDRLVEVAAEVDFAVMLITPDDIVRSRRAQKSAPRDNVVFETGLFMGNLGRRRVLPVVPEKLRLKIPSDWQSWTWISLPDDPKEHARVAAPIANAIKELGVRSRFPKEKPEHLTKA